LSLTATKSHGDVDMMRCHPKGVRPTHRRQIAAAICLAVVIVSSSAAANEQDTPSPSTANQGPRHPDEFSIDRVVPGGLRATDLDAVRRVNDRSALDRAMRDADIQRKRREAGEFEPERRYRPPSNPYEAQRRIQEEYGPDSIITRSASTVAAIAGGVEKGSAKSLDGVASVTESIVNRGGDALGFDPIDVPRLKPRISAKRAGVYVSTNW
jgi:hypothetical protein